MFKPDLRNQGRRFKPITMLQLLTLCLVLCCCLILYRMWQYGIAKSLEWHVICPASQSIFVVVIKTSDYDIKNLIMIQKTRVPMEPLKLDMCTG